MKIMKKFFLIFIFPFVLIYSVSIPSRADEITVAARGVILVEANTGEVIFEQDADNRMFPASLTKLMTALIVAEKCELDELVTANPTALKNLNPAGSSANIKEGEILTVEQLLYCALVSSGNDAANVLAMHVSNSIEGFVQLMNNKAFELGCLGTNFVNPHGLHDVSHYTTARDMYIITREFMKHSFLMKIANTVSHIIPATNKTPVQRILNTTNYLISGIQTNKYIYSYARGIKTGTTTPAGYCLVSTAEKGGLFLVCVIMGSYKDSVSGDIMSFVESKRLYENAFNNFAYKKLIETGTPIVEVEVTMSQEAETVIAITQSSVEYLLGSDFDKNAVVITPYLYSDSVEAPIIKGQVLGEADVSYNGRSYGRIKLIALTSVERSNFMHIMEKIRAHLDRPIIFIVAFGVVAIVLFYIFISVLVNRKKRLRMIKRKGRYL